MHVLNRVMDILHVDKGKPIVCFGIVPQWPGVAELWLIPDKNLIQKWKLKFHKGSLKFMELAADELNLHRLHVTVSLTMFVVSNG